MKSNVLQKSYPKTIMSVLYIKVKDRKHKMTLKLLSITGGKM